MMDASGPAFPTFYGPSSRDPSGMSLRDYFAAAALQGICANPDISRYAAERGYNAEHVRQDYARSAYAQADAMLAERAK